jgi:hypothetical protein
MENFVPSLEAITRRLRWVMLGVILFDCLNSMAAQPDSYWHHPETANSGNHLFLFFMLLGTPAWIAFQLVYIAVAFLVASMACGRGALIGIFAYIFGHYFGACTALVFRWHLGSMGFIIYGTVLACIIVAVMFPPSPASVPAGAPRP